MLHLHNRGRSRTRPLRRRFDGVTGALQSRCRLLAYIGAPPFLSEHVERPARSLISQSLTASEAETTTQASAGTASAPSGRVWRESRPAWSDENLRALCRQIRAGVLFALVRAAAGTAAPDGHCPSRLMRRTDAAVLLVSEPCDDDRDAWAPVPPGSSVRVDASLRVEVLRFAPSRAGRTAAAVPVAPCGAGIGIAPSLPVALEPAAQPA
jgi:predicted glutamine amidotransferase